MRNLYDIFVYSGFRTFPNEIMRLTEGEQKVVFAFMEKAKNERKMPIVLGNFPTKQNSWQIFFYLLKLYKREVFTWKRRK